MKSTVAILVAVIAAACAPKDQPAASPPPPPEVVSASGPGSIDALGSATSGTSAVDGPTAGSTPAPTEPPAAPAPPPLTDEQIVQVTHAANVGEINQAKLATKRSKDSRVKDLARMMLKEHEDADSKGQALAKKAGFAAAPSAVSASVEGDTQGATSTLQGASGADFDKAYVDTQVKEHKAVLALIDDKLAPNAKSADLKAYLSDIRPHIAMHLEHAEALQKAMTK